MADPVHLHGYRYSVYNRVARLALLLKKVEHQTIEVNPFAELSEAYLMLHPFGRVPVLTHGAFKLFETSAITRYVDRAFKGRALQPETAAALARMDQVIAAIDAYAYWPMVRQVASHAFFRPYFGEQSSREEVDAGLEASKTVLAFLDVVAGEGEVLTGRDITLADCHLAPMMDYFVRAEEGKAALSPHLALQRWWDRVSVLDILRVTDPFATQTASK
ncbi:glutathione S-transferase family protein [Sphingosinicella humi]|uniref:glutathione transferase n=1 Tax=Allosphingosinicella humi TaxID=2068657 RepID=A0A2U2J0Y0_9SPHN|nr:glutathione S-transferase family protein [Sphingosinicella humi]PWG01941.1 glutathione S-transferase family protein [Sphingosinicella humi]